MGEEAVKEGRCKLVKMLEYRERRRREREKAFGKVAPVDPPSYLPALRCDARRRLWAMVWAEPREGGRRAPVPDERRRRQRQRDARNILALWTSQRA